MGKKKAFKPKPPPPCSRMYLSLHENVAAVLSEHSITARFHNNENGEGATRSFPTNIFGRFTCDNKGCSGGVWISGKIATLIRQYPNDGYNAIKFWFPHSFIRNLPIDQRHESDRLELPVRIDENDPLLRTRPPPPQTVFLNISTKIALGNDSHFFEAVIMRELCFSFKPEPVRVPLQPLNLQSLDQRRSLP
ncbi:hypothetical protein SNOG_15092 [Parastagonospora nodorum SN15]|uniref:Uncharacterized protein n=1 Tax=Phaeosphaeria nodorum (strain SN15 / ATCC MYA-4574 / FGSC 10173) TaxID=321614 RepID=Q0TZS5_PHANO|nr:hypothetical protein SNOG_15092 [Parastagonospora nodorum SN15]EAT77635.1 hypothetical protein SNOG_15092 [Parastagonospora nodorum SN15]